ncbi:tRNA (adenosine(37)-N6)-threonylcarbamoyltransferase complex transferase subunit TsaD [Candidatus Micrarchaeota archaeon]|nr:tRNA (adenosine(37)-N6)-threonylcarbamoyltransferase complex transferase subunit TsaD [Candidatus Micrarchaeota archaeon]
MFYLGIESTAHTLGIGVFDSGKQKILANALDRYDLGKKGFIPRKLAEHHEKVFSKVLKQALTESKVKLSDFDAIAYSQGPGIGHCLHVGLIAAKSLSELTGKPLIPVNHCVSHIEVTRFFTKLKDPVIVYVSGGNTQIIARKGDSYKVLGETLDLGLGNFLDNLGRTLNLTPPNAIGVMNSAKGELIDLPYSIKGMNVSFTGLLTKCEKLMTEVSKKDLCYSAQETSFAMIVEATERALKHLNKKEVIVCGGVACNTRLQEMLAIMSKENHCRFGVAKDEFNRDNGAMIALTGSKAFEANCVSKEEGVNQKQRTDSVKICWD